MSLRPRRQFYSSFDAALGPALEVTPGCRCATCVVARANRMPTKVALKNGTLRDALGIDTPPHTRRGRAR